MSIKAAAVQEVREGGGPMVITQNGEAKAVLLDIVDYEQAQESFALLKMLAQSKDSYQQGRHKPAKKALADVRKDSLAQYIEQLILVLLTVHIWVYFHESDQFFGSQKSSQICY